MVICVNDAIYRKYKVALDMLAKYSHSQYVYDMFHAHGFYVNSKFISLDSNINSYEACFISLLVRGRLAHHKGTFNILEIGFARGTSTIVLLSALANRTGKVGYDILDPNQESEWNDLGRHHVHHYLTTLESKETLPNIEMRVMEVDSQIGIRPLRKKYHVAFIDGSHDAKIVLQDLMNCADKLAPHGVILVDDVLHSGVRNALHEFCQIRKEFSRVSVSESGILHRESKSYAHNMKKECGLNPATMYAYCRM